jgi:HK97 family phage major capsid protein
LEIAVSHPSPEFLAQLIAARDSAKAEAEHLVHRAKAEGRSSLTAAEDDRFNDALACHKDLSARVDSMRVDIEASGANNPLIQRLMSKGAENTAMRAPLHFPEQELRRAYEAIKRGETARVESRAFNSADSLIPAQLWQQPIGLVHEPRLLNFLPSIPMDSLSIEFIIHNSTTGSPAVVAEGGVKPELTFNVEQATVSAVKVAAHMGASYEVIADYPTFYAYCNSELVKEIIQTENSALINGSGDITGFLATSGILSYSAGTLGGGEETAIDSIELSIAGMRIGAALAEPDLFVVHPLTWSAIRRVKDSLGRYLLSPDPSIDESHQIWGIQTLVTTQIAAGTGLLLANGGSMNAQTAGQTSWGAVAIREGLSMRIGYSGTDFVQNILRTVAEERFNMCVERPQAVMSISGLPTSGQGDFGS